MRISLLTVIVLIGFMSCLAAGQTLQMQALPPQGAVVGENYSLPLTSTGGTLPYAWRLVGGDLPPGLNLRPHAGKITGVPTTRGDYRITIAVDDSSIPQLEVQRDITIRVIAGLTVDWKDAPKVHGTAISGSAVVTNGTPNDFDVTVVIVAVNKIGRATTLGYQHFTLAAGSDSPVIPFSSNPGLGTYYVRVDAVAHRPSRQHVYRASKQTTDPLKLTQF